jgi:hypothetical protein
LQNEDSETIQFMLELMNVRAKVENFKAKPATKAAGGKGTTLGSK